MYLNESNYIYDDERLENERKAKEAKFLNSLTIALQGYINSEYYNKLSESNKELINNFYNYASLTNTDIFAKLITKQTNKNQEMIDNWNKKYEILRKEFE